MCRKSASMLMLSVLFKNYLMRQFLSGLIISAIRILRWDKMFAKCGVGGFLCHFNRTGANMQFTGFKVLGHLEDQHRCQSSSIRQ